MGDFVLGHMQVGSELDLGNFILGHTQVGSELDPPVSWLTEFLSRPCMVVMTKPFCSSAMINRKKAVQDEQNAPTKQPG